MDNANNDYFKVRDNKNANVYKRLSGDVVVGDQQLIVGYIKSNTTKGTAEGINGTITIKCQDTVRNMAWYEENLSNTEAESKIEDTIYCNDRSIYSLGGMNLNGGTLTAVASTNMYYLEYKRMYVTYNPSTKCQRVADSFTKNSTRGNGLSNYSVGLITAPYILNSRYKEQLKFLTSHLWAREKNDR